MTQHLFAAAGLAFALLAGPAAAEPEAVAVQGMKTLEVTGHFRVTVQPGAAGASIDAADGQRSRVGVEVRPEGLRIWDKCVTFCGRHHPLATIAITSPDLQSIAISKGVEARVEGLTASALDAKVSMGGELVMDGRCDTLKLDGSMGAEVDASALACRAATVHAAMGADVTVRASERLEADASMGADVTVLGQPPAFSSHASMGASIERKTVD